MKTFAYCKEHVVIVLLIALLACSKVPSRVESNPNPPTDTIILTENFEWNEKDDYNNTLLNMESGQWIFASAALGNTADDKKSETQSARILGNGSINMATSIHLGTETKIKLFTAVYGTGSPSRWILLASNNGNSYVKISDTLTTSASALDSTVIHYNKSGWTSFAVQKIDGGILNIDNLEITTKTPTYSAYYIAPPAYIYNYTTPTTGTGVVGKDSLLYPLTGDNSSLLLGNPSNAVTNTASPNNYLINKRYYAESYNKERACPNWVCWHLDKTNYGAISRTDMYQADNTLPAGWYRVQNSSYNGSGYSRGHNCPSGDRTSSVEANTAVFLMTNMIPQTVTNNGGVWNNLENFTRSLTDAGNECYIIMGSYGNKGTIDNGNIIIPTNIWKVIVVLPNGNNDLNRIDANTRVIAVNTPNTDDVSNDWKTYRVSVKSIEDATGYSLLSALPATVKQALATKVDNQ